MNNKTTARRIKPRKEKNTKVDKIMKALDTAHEEADKKLEELANCCKEDKELDVR
jgi:U3 small nucleolar RNA-associated protein 14